MSVVPKLVPFMYGAVPHHQQRLPSRIHYMLSQYVAPFSYSVLVMPGNAYRVVAQHQQRALTDDHAVVHQRKQLEHAVHADLRGASAYQGDCVLRTQHWPRDNIRREGRGAWGGEDEGRAWMSVLECWSRYRVCYASIEVRCRRAACGWRRSAVHSIPPLSRSDSRSHVGSARIPQLLPMPQTSEDSFHTRSSSTPHQVQRRFCPYHRPRRTANTHAHSTPAHAHNHTPHQVQQLQPRQACDDAAARPLRVRHLDCDDVVRQPAQHVQCELSAACTVGVGRGVTGAGHGT